MSLAGCVDLASATMLKMGSRLRTLSSSNDKHFAGQHAGAKILQYARERAVGIFELKALVA
jgi:hypothetical protein